MVKGTVLIFPWVTAMPLKAATKKKPATSTESWFEKYAGQEKDSAMAFCRAHRIVKEVKACVALAEKLFQPRSTELELDVDPETGARSIVIRVNLPIESRVNFRTAYRAYTRQSVAIVPRDKSIFLRFSFYYS